MLTDTERRATNAQYMREHRQAWADAGFKPRQLMIHNLDREKVTAYADIIKYERMLKLINSNDKAAIEVAATRNIAKLPTYDVVEDFKTKVNNLNQNANAKAALTMFQAVQTYGKLHREHLAAARADEFDDAQAALAVAYGNLAHASYRLAKAYVSEVLEEQGAFSNDQENH